MNSVEAMNSDVCELGQYYTDRKTVTYMCKKISIKDNEVVSLCDPLAAHIDHCKPLWSTHRRSRIRSEIQGSSCTKR